FGGLAGGGSFSLIGARTKGEIRQAEQEADQAIKQLSSGDPALDAEDDAAAQIDPVDKEVLEEAKVTEAIQEEQQEIESQAQLQEQLETTDSAGNIETNTEESAENTTEEQEVPVSQTPEYKEAVQRIEDL